MVFKHYINELDNIKYKSKLALCFSFSPHQSQAIINLGTVSECLTVPEHIQRPEYAGGLTQPSINFKEPEIKTTDDIRRMRDSCRLAASILKKCRSVVQVTYKCKIYNQIYFYFP